MRIVSLVPSATELVALLTGPDAAPRGNDNHRLVGRSHECDWPTPMVRDVPILTAPRITPGAPAEIDSQVRAALAASESLYRLDTTRLRELRPDIVITQSLCSVCSIDATEVERALDEIHPRPRLVTLNPTSFEDLFDDILTVGTALDREPAARASIARLRERFFAASDHVSPWAAPIPTLFLEWTDPMFVAGHWTAQLIERAGGESPLNPTTPMPGAGAGAGGQQAHRTAAPGRRVTIDEVVLMQPHAAIICPCGLDLEAAAKAYEDLRTQAWWRALPAFHNNRIALVDGNQMFNRPGPRLVDAYEWLVGWLHDVPELIPKNFPWRKAT
ncbi:MAG: ABC transporter substrate-binding protein [Phycisphaerales bacterium]